jgi:hypothetical protein
MRRALESPNVNQLVSVFFSVVIGGLVLVLPRTKSRVSFRYAGVRCLSVLPIFE